MKLLSLTFLCCLFVFFTIAQPTVTSFSPGSAPAGAAVTITGTNFSTTAANNIVYFGTMRGLVTAATATSITVNVPHSSTHAPISVTTGGLTAYSRVAFIPSFSSTGGAVTALSFAPKQAISAASGATSASFGDLDGDGKADMVVANTALTLGNTLSIFRNTSTPGTVSFAPRVEITSEVGASKPVMIDMDGDGLLDLVVANYSQTANLLSIFKNVSTVGTIAFQARVNFAIDTYQSRATVTDLDLDGKPDIILTTNLGISIKRNTTTGGTYSFAATTTINGNHSGFAVADFNADRKPDLVITPISAGLAPLSFRPNTSTVGTISFGASVDFAVPENAARVGIADFDRDGHPDVMFNYVNTSTQTLSFIRNTNPGGGVIAFAPKVDVTSPYMHSLSVGNVDGDGYPDVLLANAPPPVFSVIKNTTSGTTLSFAARVGYTADNYPEDVNSVDLDGDGYPDLISVNPQSNNISVFRNLMQPPLITGIPPGALFPGGTITITGTSFTEVNAVSVGGAPAISFTVNSPTEIIAQFGATTNDQITVTSPYGSHAFPGLVVQPLPAITSLSATSGQIGSTVTINGVEFGALDRQVHFGTIKATITATTPTTTTVTVPAGAVTSSVCVTTRGRTVCSPAPFKVTATQVYPLTLSSFLGRDISTFNFNEGAVGDLDGDGKVDVVTANSGVSDISVFRNLTNSPVITFSQPAMLLATAGSGITSVKIKDLNGDGKPEIISFGNVITVFRNTSTPGTITFAPRIDFPTVGFGSLIDVADFDADGRPDLLTNENGIINSMRNVSAGDVILFGARSVVASPLQHHTVVNDVNADGKPDIIITNVAGNKVTTLRNFGTPGNISFALGYEFSVDQPGRSVVADFTGDGLPDIYVTTATGATFYKNATTSGIFDFSFTASLPKLDVASGFDADGDGAIDLVGVANNKIEVHRNTTVTNISFATAQGYIMPGGSPQQTGNADFDNDGKVDMILFTSGRIAFYRNRSGEPLISSFSPIRAGTGSTVTIQGSNFENVTSVLFGGTPASSFEKSASLITAVVGTGTTGPITVSNASGSSTIIGFSYYNGPVVNLVPPFAQKDQTTQILGAGFSTTATDNIVRFGGVRAEVTSATAVQLDVKVPSAASSDRITVTTNGLTGQSMNAVPYSYPYPKPFLSPNSFAPRENFDVGSFPRSIAMGDVDGDGKNDLLVANAGDQTVSVLINESIKSDFNFENIFDLPTGNTPESIALADLDNDGKLDIITANSAGNSISIHRNASTVSSISFQNPVEFTTATNPQAIAVADIDGDGLLDVATANFTNANVISVLRNTTSGPISFAAKIDVAVGGRAAAITSFDMNNDGLPDLAVANAIGDNITILINRSSIGNVLFNTKVDYATGPFPTAIVPVEINGDNFTDLAVITMDDNQLQLFINQTGLTFSGSSKYTTPTSPAGLAAGNANGDQRNDLIVSGGGANGVVSVFTNAGSGLNSGFVYSVGTTPYEVVAADLDGDGLTDIAAANDGSQNVSVLRNIRSVAHSFSPMVGTTGTPIVIEGENLTQTSAVTFGLTPASSFVATSDGTKVTAVVGSGTTGGISVSTPDGGSNIPGFLFMVPHSIDMFSPTTAGTGQAVTITGTNLENVTSVKFGGVEAADFSIENNSTIIAHVGAGESGSVSVTRFGSTKSVPGFEFKDPTTGIDSDAGKVVRVFPNPTSGIGFQLSFTPPYHGKVADVMLTDITGRAVHRSTITCREVVRWEPADGKPVSPGLYLVRVMIEGRSVVTKLAVE